MTVIDPNFVRNVATLVELSYEYSHTYGARIPSAPDTHMVTVTASNADLSTDITLPVFDILYAEQTDWAINQTETNSKTLTIR